MKTANKGLDLIKSSEGLRLKAYLCPAGIWTIGYGHTDADVKKNQVITEQEAEELLRKDLQWAERAVDRCVRSQITQVQFDALVSFTYNLGETALKKSTLLKKVNANPDDLYIRDCFMMYVKAGGRTLAGLVRRRQAEADLYFS